MIRSAAVPLNFVEIADSTGMVINVLQWAVTVKATLINQERKLTHF